MAQFSVTKAPKEEMSLTNMVFFSRPDFNEKLKHCAVQTESGAYTFKASFGDGVPQGKVAFGLMQRKYANLSLDQPIRVTPFVVDQSKDMIGTVLFAVNMHSKKNIPKDPLDADLMARELSMQFCELPLTVNQQLFFKFADYLFILTVVEIKNTIYPTGEQPSVNLGVMTGNSIIFFERAHESQLMFYGNASKSSNVPSQAMITPNWNFEELGIGGLDKEFAAIFRRAFASRMFPPEVTKKMGIQHVRGMLLYGPPGTGKTLMARQIGSMLNAREPKIVNGPSILDKYVGESEANIRKLFAEAEEENKRMGAHSALHIIIFDEIDAICKQRGSVNSGSGVHDTVVNQLLTKMDGVDQLNNILVIGMTNRRDMIDEALLRPGRFELQMEISLPNEAGRLQILEIHTSKLRRFDKLGKDVELAELAHRTKNFSGAEIEGLCRAAVSTAMNQLIERPQGGAKEIDQNALEKLKITRQDFLYALDNDIKPMFGTAEEELSKYRPRGIINFGQSVSHALDMGRLTAKAVSETEVETYRPMTILLEGASKTGKTALAVEIAQQSGFPFVKICTSHKMTGFTETAKCQMMKKTFDDAAKSPLSVVIVDNIEGLIEYNPVGPRFSNYMVQAIKDLVTQPLPAGRHMLVIGTTSCKDALDEQRLTQAFSWTVHVSPITTVSQLMNVLEEDGRFDQTERAQIERNLTNNPRVDIRIGIKHLIDMLDLTTKTDKSTRVSQFLVKLESDSDPNGI